MARERPSSPARIPIMGGTSVPARKRRNPSRWAASVEVAAATSPHKMISRRATTSKGSHWANSAAPMPHVTDSTPSVT